jgi:hypothetical protein
MELCEQNVATGRTNAMGAETAGMEAEDDATTRPAKDAMGRRFHEASEVTELAKASNSGRME